MPEPTRIGRLRWPVLVLLRQQIPDPDSSGIIEIPVDQLPYHADIQPMGPVAFYGGVTAQGDNAPTHRITLRWLDEVDTRHAIVRLTNRPDGSPRVEIFRVRRVLGDLDGRKRFTVIEAQLETSQ